MSQVDPTARQPAKGSTAKWFAVAFLAVAACCLLVQVGISIAADESPGAAASGGKNNVFVVAGQVTKDTYGLYLVDLEYGTICMYEWVPQSRKLRLMAARTYVYDRQLDDYNTELSPQEVKKLIAEQRRLGESPAKP